MKKIQSICFAVFIATAVISQPVKENGRLAVKGTHLVNESGNAIVLRGMSFGWHNWWPRFFNEGAVKWLKNDWGCNVVRAAMGVDPDGAYLSKPEFSKEKIRNVVDAAIKEGIYVIIDWHSHNIRLDEARQFFKEMATAYGRYPNVIYEIFNEPERQLWAEVKDYSIDIINAIRAIDPDNIILVGSPHWDQDVHVVADDPITGQSNLMYTFHFYAATHKQSLRDRGTYALGKGLPLFISESAGMEATGNGPLNEGEWNKWIAWAEDNKVSWITWSVSDKNETCSVLLPSAASEGNWQEIDLKESGKKARALIRKFNGTK